MLDVKMVGSAEAKAFMEVLRKQMPATLANAMGAAAVLVTNTAKQLAPKDTGKLAVFIDYEMTENSDSQTVVKVGPTNNITYAKYVEHGTGIYAEEGNGRKTAWVYFSEKLNRFVRTVGSRPQPFLYPALQKNLKKISTLLEVRMSKYFGAGKDRP